MSRAVIDALIHSANEAMFTDNGARCGYVREPGNCNHGVQVRRYFEGALRALELLGITDAAALKEFMIDAGMTSTVDCYKPGERFRPSPEHAEALLEHQKRTNLQRVLASIDMMKQSGYEGAPIFWARYRVEDRGEDAVSDGSAIVKCQFCNAACWKTPCEFDLADAPPGLQFACTHCAEERVEKWIAENRGGQ